MFGGPGADQLLGDAGDDQLDGGPGRDTLTGGLGNDLFTFPSDENRDEVTDFTYGEDRVVLTETTMLHGLSLDQIQPHLIPGSGGTLLRDQDGRQMLFLGASAREVVNSIDHQ